jgi:SAM-dependent methyltransferase
MAEESPELERIAERYRRRSDRPSGTAFARCAIAEREAIYRELLVGHSGGNLGSLRLLEIGCGGGGELARFLRLGLRPELLVGNELLPERLAVARAALPASLRLLPGDASMIDLPNDSFDVVFQSTVFTSILDDALAERLARRMWELVRPGGAILWYDFTVNNPRNPDVRGVPGDRVAELFPHGAMRSWRVTLAPPLGRAVAPLGSWAYRALASIPFLRTHLIAWIVKPTP